MADTMTSTPTVDAVITETVTDITEQSSERLKDKAVTELILNGKHINLDILSPEQKNKFQALAKCLNPKDFNSVANYGCESYRGMDKISSRFTACVNAKDLGEIGEHVPLLAKELRRVNLDDIKNAQNPNTFTRFVSKLPIIRHLVTTMEDIKISSQSVEKNIVAISQKIEAGRTITLSDNTTLELMKAECYTHKKQLEELIVAGKLKINELYNQLKEMENHKEDFESSDFSQLANYIDNLDQKVTDLQIQHQLACNTIPQITLIQNNNCSLARQAESIIGMIPEWRTQLALATAIERQRKTNEFYSVTRSAIGETIAKNAENLATNTKEIAKAAGRGVIEMEKLRAATEKTFQALDDAQHVYEDNIKARRQLEVELADMRVKREERMNAHRALIAQVAEGAKFISGDAELG